MYSIAPLRPDIIAYLRKHHLEKKWQKAHQLFETSPRHPSLHTELLEPKENLIYSFRLDRKYRALFIVRANQVMEIINITNHYS